MKEIELDLALRSRMDFIAKKVKSERLKRGWDVTELVIRSRVNQVTIYNIENGVSDNITLKSLIGIAKAFEVDMVMLLA